MLSEEDQAFIRQQDELARKYRQKAEKYGRITTVLAIITALLWLCNIALHATHKDIASRKSHIGVASTRVKAKNDVLPTWWKRFSDAIDHTVDVAVAKSAEGDSLVVNDMADLDDSDRAESNVGDTQAVFATSRFDGDTGSVLVLKTADGFGCGVSGCASGPGCDVGTDARRERKSGSDNREQVFAHKPDSLGKK